MYAATFFLPLQVTLNQQSRSYVVAPFSLVTWQIFQGLCRDVYMAFRCFSIDLLLQ